MHRVLILFLCSVLCALAWFSNAYSIKVIRDNEVEEVIKEIASPIFAAAGINKKHVRIFLLDDYSVNAFVIDNNNIFINLGLLQYSTEPYVLLGVLAHEIAHISAGHIFQMNAAINDLRMALLASTLGMIAGVLCDYNLSTVSLGSLAVGAQLFFSYSQEQESIADSYALKYLDESQYSNKGVKELFNYLKRLDVSNDNGNEYFRTHPLSEKRLFLVQNYKVKNEPNQISEKKVFKFKRVVAKLDAFFTPIRLLSDKYKDDGDIAQYVNAIIYYRQGRVNEAITKIMGLMHSLHDDPYLYELVAEMLYKSGRLDEAVAFYEKSLRYDGNRSYLTKLALSHTFLINGEMKKAMSYLEQIVNDEQDDALVWKYLSVVYENENLGMHYFALTKKAFIEKNDEQFAKHAQLAIASLPSDSIYLLQIEDMRGHI